MAANISLMVGNTNPPVTDRISTVDESSPNGTPVDLTDATVKFCMRLLSSSTLVVDANATVTAALTGDVEYQWSAGDVDTAGVYAAWFRITFQDDSILDTPEFTVRIKEHAPVTGGYTTVAAVRDLLGTDTNDTFADDLIEDLILRYSRAVDDECGVSFLFESSDDGVTKRFRFYGTKCNFVKWGLSSATSIVLSPENIARELVEDVDYFLLPFNKEYGTYTSIKLSGYLSASYSTSDRMGFNVLDVTGDWGCEVIPPVIEYAVAKATAAQIIRSALRTGALPSDDATADVPVFLPADVRASLRPYKRYGY